MKLRELRLWSLNNKGNRHSYKSLSIPLSYITQTTMKMEQRIEELEKRVQALEQRHNSSCAQKVFGCELDESVTDVSKSHYSSSKNKTVQDSKQPDWENLLSVDDVKKLCSIGGWYSHTNALNRTIHHRIKPLLDDNNSLHEEVISLEFSLRKANEQIEDLRQSYKDCKYQRDDYQHQLKEANHAIAQLEAIERIAELEANQDTKTLQNEIDRLNKQCIVLAKQNAELEALNKTYKLSILESYRINKPN